MTSTTPEDQPDKIETPAHINRLTGLRLNQLLQELHIEFDGLIGVKPPKDDDLKFVKLIKQKGLTYGQIHINRKSVIVPKDNEVYHLTDEQVASLSKPRPERRKQDSIDRWVDNDRRMCDELAAQARVAVAAALSKEKDEEEMSTDEQILIETINTLIGKRRIGRSIEVPQNESDILMIIIKAPDEYQKAYEWVDDLNNQGLLSPSSESMLMNNVLKAPWVQISSNTSEKFKTELLKRVGLQNLISNWRKQTNVRCNTFLGRHTTSGTECFAILFSI